MPSPSTPFDSTTRRPLFKRRYWIVLALLLGAVFIFWKLPSWQREAEVGTAYAARMGCSCHYVEGRDTKSCSSDFEPGMGMISLDADDEAKTMTASAPLLASRSARFAGASGCVLDPE